MPIRRRYVSGVLLPCLLMLLGACAPQEIDRLNELGFGSPANDWRSQGWSTYVGEKEVITAIPYLQRIRAHRLDLNAQYVSDRIIPYIVEVKSLETLDLSGTDVTMNGLRQLTALPKLKTLYISEAYYVPESLEQLARLLPRTSIEDNFLTGTDWRRQRDLTGKKPTARPALK